MLYRDRVSLIGPIPPFFYKKLLNGSDFGRRYYRIYVKKWRRNTIFPFSPNRGIVLPQLGKPKWRQLFGRPNFPKYQMLQKIEIGFRSQFSYLPNAICPLTISLNNNLERRKYPKFLKPGGIFTFKVFGLKVYN